MILLALTMKVDAIDDTQIIFEIKLHISFADEYLMNFYSSLCNRVSNFPAHFYLRFLFSIVLQQQGAIFMRVLDSSSWKASLKFWQFTPVIDIEFVVIFSLFDMVDVNKIWKGYVFIFVWLSRKWIQLLQKLALCQRQQNWPAFYWGCLQAFKFQKIIH